MEIINRLIELYKRNLENKTNLIWCNNKYGEKKQKEFDSDSVIINFFKKETKKELTFENGYKLPIKYSLGKDSSEICLCEKIIYLYENKIYDTKEIKHKRKFLFITYTKKEIIKENNNDNNEYLIFLKNKGFIDYSHSDDSYFKFKKHYYFITFENLMFEINEDMFKELEAFTLKTIEERSTSNLINAK